MDEGCGCGLAEKPLLGGVIDVLRLITFEHEQLVIFGALIEIDENVFDSFEDLFMREGDLFIFGEAEDVLLDFLFDFLVAHYSDRLAQALAFV